MAPPGGRIHDADGNEIKDGSFDYARRYGEEIANLADKAFAAAEPIELTPFVVSAKAITVPVENSYYKTARALGVLQREGIPWTGNFEEVLPPQSPDAGEKLAAVESEVAYLRLGDLHVVGIPGEIYPELVYGKFQEPADPGADEPQHREPTAEPPEEIVLAGECALDQPLVDGSRAHHGLAEVEPVALGAGGMPTAAPAGSCGAGLAAWSFRRWLTMAQRSAGR